MAGASSDWDGAGETGKRDWDAEIGRFWRKVVNGGENKSRMGH